PAKIVRVELIQIELWFPVGSPAGPCPQPRLRRRVRSFLIVHVRQGPGPQPKEVMVMSLNEIEKCRVVERAWRISAPLVHQIPPGMGSREKDGLAASVCEITRIAGEHAKRADGRGCWRSIRNSDGNASRRRAVAGCVPGNGRHSVGPVCQCCRV